MTTRPKILSSQLVYRGFFDLREDLLQHPNGQTLSYTSLVLSTNAAAVLAQDSQGRWILNREYRHPTKEVVLGCPGGRLEPNEDPIPGGQRELFEETGYWSDDIVLIGCCYPFPAVCDQKIYFLWAKNAVKKAAQNLDPLEFIETEVKTDAELRKAIRAGTNVDAVLCAALWYKDHFC
ncbi:MAG TPA: NUDIX hydrolase [Chlamydiales bacterium]|nr:NUDIX hydrolase [Chlamydiales bacterium]